MHRTVGSSEKQAFHKKTYELTTEFEPNASKKQAEAKPFEMPSEESFHMPLNLEMRLFKICSSDGRLLFSRSFV